MYPDRLMPVTVFRKTDKGQAEIETRAFRLPPRLRTALIVVDGRKTDAELAKLIPGEPHSTLSALLADGFIEVASVQEPRIERPPECRPEPAAAAAGAPAGTAATVAAPRKPVPIDVVRREAVRFLNDKMGPAAEGIAIKLERAKTMPELRPLLVSAAQLLSSFHGADAASAFAQRFLSDEEG